MTNIAILGFGVVGSGTAEVLSRCNNRSNHRQNQNINLKYIVHRRDLPDSPYQDKIVKDFTIVEKDPDLHIVVETIGGTDAAYDMTKRALLAGKSVVTSNKELVAVHGAELLAIAKEKNCNYLFESAVGGGIPILRPLTTCLMGNNIQEITGILNGTTNFILSKMTGLDKISYEDALKEAQRLGFAEQDPSADVEGKDACRKISILGNIAFGGTINPDTVPTEGITKVTLKDMAFLSYLFSSVKLVGRTFQNDKGEIFAYVSPHVVSLRHPFKLVNDAFNMVEVTCDSLGKTHFFGQGAGALPTASAVVGDVLDLANDLHRDRNNGWKETPITLADITTVPMDFYVRCHNQNQEVKEKVTTKNYHFIDSCQLSDEDFQDWGRDTSACIFKNISRKELEENLQGLTVENIIPFLED